LAAIKSHRDLLVWQKSMDLTQHVYALTRRFPADERFALTSQLRRAVASVPANIAEGHARETRRDYAQFLAVAQGSLAETETFLLLSQRLGYVNEATLRPILELLTEVARMLSALRTRPRAANSRQPTHAPSP
jgi:four helix bundle protein